MGVSPKYFNGNLQDMINEFQDVVKNEKSFLISDPIQTVNVIENKESCEGLKRYDTNKKYESIKLKLKQEIIDRTCQFCGYIFTQRCHLLRHQKNQTCDPSRPTHTPNKLSNNGDDLK